MKKLTLILIATMLSIGPAAAADNGQPANTPKLFPLPNAAPISSKSHASRAIMPAPKKWNKVPVPQSRTKQTTTPEQLQKLRNFVAPMLNNKPKAAPKLNIPPTKQATPPPAQNPKAPAGDRFQAELNSLPKNIRMPAEFEEVQAVLVSLPSSMATVAGKTDDGYNIYAECWFMTDMDEYVAEAFAEAGIEKDFTVLDIPAGYAYCWPVALGFDNDPSELYIIPPAELLRIPFMYWDMETTSPAIDGGQVMLWAKLIDAIQTAGATALIRYSAIGLTAEPQADMDTNYIKEMFANEEIGYPLGPNHGWASNTLEDAFWCRDWGPLAIYYDDAAGNRKLGFMDAKYYTGRQFDDQFNTVLYNGLGYDYYNLDVKMEGGNIMNDGYKFGIYGDVIYSENAANEGSYGQFEWNETTQEWQLPARQPLTPVQTDSRLKAAFGFDAIVMESLKYDGGTGHIDLWNKQFDEETILVAFGESTPSKYSGLTDYKTVQRNREKYKSIKTAFGTNYRLLDAPMPRLDNADMPTTDAEYNKDPRGYLNGVTVNDCYIYPSFSSSANDANWQLDSTNNEILKKLLPGYQLIPIDSRLLTPGGGAIHCITMQIPAEPNNVVTIRHKPLRDEQPTANSFELTAELLASTKANRVTAIELAWRRNGSDWHGGNYMTKIDGVWKGTIDGTFKAGDTINYMLTAIDTDNHEVLKTAPITAKRNANTGGYYTFWLSGVGIDELYGFQPSTNAIASVYPSPASDYVNIIFELTTPSNVAIEILNTLGQSVKTPLNQYFNTGVYTFDINNLTLPAGTYIIKMTTSAGVDTYNFIVR